MSNANQYLHHLLTGTLAPHDQWVTFYVGLALVSIICAAACYFTDRPVAEKPLTVADIPLLEKCLEWFPKEAEDTKRLIEAIKRDGSALESDYMRYTLLNREEN